MIISEQAAENGFIPVSSIREAGKIAPLNIDPILHDMRLYLEHMVSDGKPLTTLCLCKTAEFITSNKKYEDCFDRKMVGGYLLEETAADEIQKITKLFMEKLPPCTTMEFRQLYGNASKYLTETFRMSDIYMPAQGSLPKDGDIISATVSYEFDRNGLIDMAEGYADKEDEDQVEISGMLAEKINLHNVFVPCIQMEVMEEIAKTAGDPLVSQYADRILGYMEAITGTDGAYPGLGDNAPADLRRLPVIPLIAAEDMVSRTDRDGVFSQQFILRMKLDRSGGQGEKPSQYHERVIRNAWKIEDRKKREQAIKTYLLYYYIDIGRLPDMKHVKQLLEDMKSYRIKTDYSKIAEGARTAFKKMKPFEQVKYLNLKRTEWKNLVSGYDGDNDRQLKELYKSAYIRGCGPGLPVKIAFDYTAFEKADSSNSNSSAVTMVSDTSAAVLPITLMSPAAWNKYEAQKSRLPELANFYEKSKKLITATSKNTEGKSALLYDFAYTILATIYLMVLLNRMPEGVKKRTIHILRLHSGNVQDKEETSPFGYNVCETCGSDEYIKSLGYSLEAVLNKVMATASTQGYNLEEVNRFKTGNALSSLFHNLPAYVRNGPDTEDVMIVYRTKSPSDSEDYSRKMDISSAEVWIKKKNMFWMLGIAHDITPDAYDMKEEGELIRLLKRGYKAGIRNLVYLADAPFSVTTAKTEDKNMYYMDRDIFIKLMEIFPELDIFPLYMSDYQIFGEFDGRAVIGGMDRVFGSGEVKGRLPLFALAIAQPGFNGKSAFRNSTMYQTENGYFDDRTNRNVKRLTDMDDTKTKAVLFALFCLHMRTNEKMSMNKQEDGKLNPFNRLKNTLASESQVKYRNRIVCYMPLVEKIVEMAIPALEKEK